MPVAGGRPRSANERPDGPGWTLTVAAVALLAASCAPPDRPAALPDPLPETVLEVVEPDTARASRLADGVFYRYLWSARGPWGIHLVEVDLDRCEIGFSVLRADPEPGMAGGRARVTELVSGTPAGVVAAVNGDFFTPEGLPVGPEVSSGAVRRPGERPAFAWAPGRGPWIGTTGVRGDTLVAGLAVESGRAALVGGFPELLDGSRRVGDLEVRERASFAAARHPRTAVGFSRTARKLWLVVVDGRQGSYSQGMTLPELTRFFEALGTDEALNLDGGGSSVLVVGRGAVSRPSDTAGERPVVNALALLRDRALCRVPGRPG